MIALYTLCSHNYVDQLMSAMPEMKRVRFRHLVKSLLGSTPPDAIHIQFLIKQYEFILILLLSKLRRVPIVWTPHDAHVEHDERYAYSFFPFFLWLTDAIVALSHYEKKTLVQRGIPAEKIHVIPYPNANFWRTYTVPKTRARKYLGIPMGKTVFLQFGPILPYKGFDVSSNAFNHLTDMLKNKSRLVFGGKILDQKHFESIRQETDTKYCLAHRYLTNKEVGILYSAADVILYPYRAINQSGAIYDALAFGKASIATKAGGIPEVIQNRRESILLTDTNKNFTSAMATCIRYPALVKHMGQNATKNSNRLSWQDTANDHRKIYHMLAITNNHEHQ